MNFIENITEITDENGTKIRTIIRTQIKPPSYTPQTKAAIQRYREAHREQISAYHTELQKKKYNSDPEYRLKVREQQRIRGEKKRRERYENDPEYREMIDRRTQKPRKSARA